MAGERSAKYRQEIQQVRFVPYKSYELSASRRGFLTTSTTLELSAHHPFVVVLARSYIVPGSVPFILVLDFLFHH